MKTDFLTIIYMIAFNILTAFDIIFVKSNNDPLHIEIFIIFSVWFFINVFSGKYLTYNNMQRFSLYFSYAITINMIPFVLFNYFIKNVDWRIIAGAIVFTAIFSMLAVYNCEKSRNNNRLKNEAKTHA